MSRDTLAPENPQVRSWNPERVPSQIEEEAARRQAELRQGADVLTDAGPDDGGTPLATDEILIRGAAAARAKRIDLVARRDTPEVQAVGPWAEELERTREQARLAGFEQGRREGHTQGMAEGQEQLDRELAEMSAMITTLTASIATLADQVEVRLDEIGESASNAVVDLALEIAEAVLGREVSVADDPGAEAIARCLDMAPAYGDLVAHLNPDDAARLGEIEGLEDRRLVVTTDPTIASGDAVVMVDDATIDARLSESLRRVAEALR
ncbi:MAG: FliH/SctL family protein [Actinomycetota bacterium]